MARPPNTPPALAAAMAAEDWDQALRLAARFPFLGPGRGAILSAWNALQRPAFYRELGHDPAALREAGIAALRARFTPPHSRTALQGAPAPE